MSERDDQPFRHHTLKHRIISWISRNVFDHLTYTVRRGLLKGMRRKGGLAWLPDFGGAAAQTPEHRFLAGLDFSGKVIFDVGAFEGLLTLFFTQRAQRVVCYEPNPRNMARLRKNLELNHVRNVTLRQLGLGAHPCSMAMVWDPAMAGAATVEETNMARTIGAQKSARREEIQITTLDQDLADALLPRPDLIKLDVEGYELPVLQGARSLLETVHPALYLEMHGETMNEKRRNVRAIVDYLTQVGYQDILHIESGERITPGNCDCAAEGHLHVTSTNRR
jgi:FkbM family methyltransferase